VEQVVVGNSMISKDDLAKRFNVSSKTILRDLKKLGYAWEGASKNGRWVKKG
jgi:ATP-dependent DNA helicase RecG